ncbi:KH domain-containing protein HEN4 [Linum grandiflorum]
MDSPSNLSKFRILCPSVRTGAVIGKGGATVRHIQSVTAAKIRLLDNPHGHPPCDERVILISHVNNPFSSSNNRNPRPATADEATTSSATENTNRSSSHPQDSGETDGSSTVPPKGSGGESGEEGWGPVHKALVRVFEKIVKGDSVEELGEEVVVVGRVLVGNDQAACLFGRGGNVLEKIMVESGAQQVRLLPRDQIPPCAAQGDELILITGSYSAVRRALLCFYACLEDISKAEAANPGSTKPSGLGHHGPMDFPQRGYADYHPSGRSPNMGPENFDSRSMRVVEEDVVFKLLCQLDKVGSLIGKGGAVIKTLQNDTGASIKIADVLPDLQERLVIISAREAWELNSDKLCSFPSYTCARWKYLNSEQRHSPAQDGVIRVQTRIAEIGYEHGAPVVARLVVHSQQIGRLLGKGGQIISEMRQATGAHIRIFPKEQVAKHGTPHDEIVQVIGNLQCVQDALYHITGRLREIIFPVKPPFSNNAGPPPYHSQFSDMPPPQFRPRPHPSSSGHYPSPGPYHGGDHPGVPPHHQDHQPGFSYGNNEHGGAPYEISPRSWNPQPFSNGNPHGGGDAGPGYAVRNGPPTSGGQPVGMPVEMVIPPNFLNHVYGEKNSNLNQIIQISGANIVVQEAKTGGGGEGVAVISGASDQIHIAKCLIHGFILTGRAAA